MADNDNKKQVWSWALFDFANSSFAVIIVAFVFAVYFKKVVAQDLPIGDWYWSLAIAISMTIVAILNPILGAVADFHSNKKSFLLFFTLLSIVATSLLYFSKEGMIFYAMVVFIVANIGFQIGLGFYDAFLPEIAEEKDFNRISSLGYAVGYAGSFLSVLIVLPLKGEPRITFLVTSIMFFLFSLPLFLFLKERKQSIEQTQESFFLNWITSRSIYTKEHFAIFQLKKFPPFLFHLYRWDEHDNFLLGNFRAIDFKILH